MLFFKSDSKKDTLTSKREKYEKDLVVTEKVHDINTIKTDDINDIENSPLEKIKKAFNSGNISEFAKRFFDQQELESLLEDVDALKKKMMETHIEKISQIPHYVKYEITSNPKTNNIDTDIKVYFKESFNDIGDSREFVNNVKNNIRNKAEIIKKEVRKNYIRTDMCYTLEIPLDYEEKLVSIEEYKEKNKENIYNRMKKAMAFRDSNLVPTLYDEFLKNTIEFKEERVFAVYDYLARKWDSSSARKSYIRHQNDYKIKVSKNDVTSDIHILIYETYGSIDFNDLRDLVEQFKETAISNKLNLKLEVQKVFQIRRNN